MTIKLALYGTIKSELKQAKIEYIKIAFDTKLDLKIKLFTKFTDFISNFNSFDIAAVHDKIFYTILPEIMTSIKERHSEPLSKKMKVIIGMFSIPVNAKDFRVWIDNLPKCSITLDIPIVKGCKTENISNIIYFENINRKVYIKTVLESYHTILTMKEASELTASHPFASPYVSYLVNLEWVEQITRRDVILKNQDIIPLSQKRAAQFRKIYREYMSKT